MKLESIVSAQTQVVAGLNYQFELQTDGGEYQATVYSALPAFPPPLPPRLRTGALLFELGSGMWGGWGDALHPEKHFPCT